MDHARRAIAAASPPLRWSTLAGLYMFACGTATAYLLEDLLALLGDVIGLPAAAAMVILASPAFVFGAVVWWAVVERRRTYSYRLGVVFGLITALLTGLLWTVRFVSVWGLEVLGVEVVSLLVVFVLGVVAIVGGLTSLPLMYARRRLHRRSVASGR